MDSSWRGGYRHFVANRPELKKARVPSRMQFRKGSKSMPSRSSILAATSAFLVLALGFGWFGLRSARQAETSLAALRQNLARLNASVQQARDQMTEAAAEARPHCEQNSKACPLTAVATKIVSVPNPLPTKDPATLMASDPKLRSLYLKAFRAGLVRKYRPMYEGLGLNQLQIDKFEDLATAHADDVVTMQAAAREQGIKPSDPDFAALEKQSTGSIYATVAQRSGRDDGHSR